MSLKEQTEQLLVLLDECKDRFEMNEPPARIKDHHFFTNMKNETAPTFDLIQEWEEGALEFVKDKDVHVHPHQVASTRENFELIILHSYYIDARRKRYMELHKSSEYIFDQLIVEIDRKMKAGENDT